MRNKCKIVALGFVVSCVVVGWGWWVPGVGAVEEEKHLDRIGALEARITALETQVAQLKKSIDQIITKSQPPTIVDANLAADYKTKQIQSEALRQKTEAEKRYQGAVKRRKALELEGDKEREARRINPKIRSTGVEDEYREAIQAEETARKEMLEAQKRYQEILQPKPSK